VNRHEDRGRREPGAGGVRPLEGLLSETPAAPAGATGAAGGRHLRLRPSVEPWLAPSGELFLLRTGAADLRIDSPDALDRGLLRLLQAGAVTASEAAARLDASPADLAAKLAALLEADVVREVSGGLPRLAPEEAARFERQLPYLAEYADPCDLQRRLRAARVLLLGCGGLGTWALMALVSAGVGSLTLVDDDVVELSNLNRQIAYGVGALGRPKVEAAASWVAEFDPSTAVRAVQERVEGVRQVRALADAADVVVVTADWPPYELGRWVNTACVDARVPFVMAGQVPPILKVGPLYVPGATACFECHERALRSRSPHYDDYVAHARANPAPATTLGPASGMVGAAVAMELMHLLIGATPATRGTACLIDLRDLTSRRETIDRDPDCPACQHLM
jgi:bacteriocin biosynthesis cyclodehydratase domain-containing protein